MAGDAIAAERGRLRQAIWVVQASRTATLGAGVVAALILVVIFAQLLAPHDPLEQTLAARTQPPSAQYLLGTDRLGRDILSRLLYGARLSLAVGLGAVAIGASLGILTGLAAGFYRGWVDVILMRLMDVMLAFPLYVVAMVLVAILGPSLVNVMLAVGLATYPQFTRLVRGQVLVVRELEFVTAAKAIGASGRRIAFRHVMPQTLGPVVVLSTLTVGSAILVEASLSFIGLGPPPPAPSWGSMIFDGLPVLQRAPWVPLAPGVAITSVVLGFNLLGDGLRDAMDPRLRT